MVIPVRLGQAAYAGYQAQSLNTGTWVTGLTASDFTLALWRESGGDFIAAAETITLTEQDATDLPGFYQVSFTPAYSGTYLLKITPTFSFAAGGEERYAYEVTTVAIDAANYATLAQLRAYLGLSATDTTDDALLADLLAFAEATIDKETGRSFLSRSVTWDLDAEGADQVALPDYPATVTAVYETTDVPRVYDSTTLLASGEDYIADTAAGVIHRLSGNFVSGPSTVRVTATAGPDTVPESVVWCCLRIASIYYRSRLAGGLSGYNSGDGSVTHYDHDRLPYDVLAALRRLRGPTVR